MRAGRRRLPRFLLLLVLLLPAAPLRAAPLPPELADFWVGDVEGDAGGWIAVRWRNAHPDPPTRFWRVSIKQVGLPGEDGRMIPVDGPERWPRPLGLSTDFTALHRFMRDQEGPFWCWPPVPDPAQDTHWVTVDLGLFFPPQAMDEPARSRELDRIRRGVYQVRLLYQDDGMTVLEPVGQPRLVSAKADLWRPRQMNHLVLTALLGLLAAWGIRRRPAPEPRIPPPLRTVEAALASSATGGGPLLVLPGAHGLKDPATQAALSLLDETARRAADAGARLQVLHGDAAVMAAAEALTEGRRCRAEHILAADGGDRFAYAAAARGLIARESPVACLLLGYPYAEALLLADAARHIPCIAATDNEAQLPALAVACDGLLPGEGLHAAGPAWAGRGGILAGQDAGRLLLIALMAAGAAAAFASPHLLDALRAW